VIIAKGNAVFMRES